MFVEDWSLDFHFFAIRLATFWVYEDGRIIKQKRLNKLPIIGGRAKAQKEVRNEFR